MRTSETTCWPARALASSIATLVALAASIALAQPATAPAEFDWSPPPGITLALDRVPALEAFERLFKQAEISFAGMPEEQFVQQLAGLTVTARFENEPFISALMELCRQTGVEPARPPTQERVVALAPQTSPQRIPGPTTKPTTTSTVATTTIAATLPATAPTTAPTTAPATRASWVDAPAAIAQPLFIAAVEARRTRRFDLENAGAASGELMLSFRAACDPRVRLYTIADSLVVDAAEDETGRSLVRPRPAGEPMPYERPARVGSHWTIPLRAALAYPPESSRTLALFRGRLNAAIVARVEPVDLLGPDGMMQGERSAGALRFSIAELQPWNEGWRTVLTIARDPAMQAPHEEMQSILHVDGFRVSGEDPEVRYGLLVNVQAIHPDRVEAGVIIRPFRRQLRPPPAPPIFVRGAKPPTKIIWDVPVEVADVVLPVEFKDLPLP